MIIPTTTAKERMKTRQPHAKRITSVISSFTSHRPISHAKRLPPYRLQQKPERMSRTDQPNNLCRGRLSLFLFPLCISLAVFIITTFFLCIDELSWLISCASCNVFVYQRSEIANFKSVKVNEPGRLYFDVTCRFTLHWVFGDTSNVVSGSVTSI